jgi:hypothetical protein
MLMLMAAAAVVVVGSNSILGFALLGLPRCRLLRRSYPYLSCRCESEQARERPAHPARASSFAAAEESPRNGSSSSSLSSRTPSPPAILFSPSARRNEPTARTRNFLSRGRGRNARTGDFVSCSRGDEGRALWNKPFGPLVPRLPRNVPILQARVRLPLAEATFAISPDCSSRLLLPLPRRRALQARHGRAGSGNRAPQGKLTARIMSGQIKRHSADWIMDAHYGNARPKSLNLNRVVTAAR